MHRFAEFFAGGGMARAGLGTDWRCVLANDNDKKKAEAYANNWGAGDLLVDDIRALDSHHIPGQLDLAWASFPCQDLSLAGTGTGIRGPHSGTFWPFWDIIRALHHEDRAPRSIVLENVVGALTSHQGKDFRSIAEGLAELGYRFGALVIDAARFVPQSRPRLFIVAMREDVHIPDVLRGTEPDSNWHTRAVIHAHSNLRPETGNNWIWWSLPTPKQRTTVLGDLVEAEPRGVQWDTKDQTEYLLSLMSEVNRRKVDEATRLGRQVVGTVYRRTRNGQQRAEVRFDDVAGCLRTPVGGSSRQRIVVVDGNFIRSRLLSPREAARLMGLPEGYKLPENYNTTYHLLGDGVAVPVVNHLARHLLRPALTSRNSTAARTAA